MTEQFNPTVGILGGYEPLDGTIEFYMRVTSILKKTDVVVDLGAGRGAWFSDDKCEMRRQTRNIKLKVSKVIGLDVDPVVLMNQTTTENHIIKAGKFPLPNQSVDMVIADYVLEHVSDVKEFTDEVKRILKPGWYFCARTPHKYEYVTLFSRLVTEKHHGWILRKVQSGRKNEDVFPATYKLNTIRGVTGAFPDFQDYSYLYSSEPSYYCGSKLLYKAFSLLHRILPRFLVSNIFIFKQKNQ